MNGFARLIVGLWIASSVSASAELAISNPELIEARKIWDAAPHNAFTDLVRFKGKWFCVFREGQAHVSPDGALRVITSDDGEAWTPAARLTDSKADLRDPKITVTPDNKLMLTGVAAFHQPHEFKHQTLCWISDNGQDWTDPIKIGDPNMWLWRVTWHKKTAYSIGYSTVSDNFVRLYSSQDGRQFNVLLPELFAEGYPNETALAFVSGDNCLCLLRRDGDDASAKLGVARPPFTDWSWKDLGLRIGGPNMIRLPDGRILCASRLYDGGARTSLLWLDPDKGTLNECLKLPSGGDTSYPGLVWHDQLLWMSYYSSHDGKTSIYLAKIKLR